MGAGVNECRDAALFEMMLLVLIICYDWTMGWMYCTFINANISRCLWTPLTKDNYHHALASSTMKHTNTWLY